jgi:vacuolar fusion protein MON1
MADAEQPISANVALEIPETSEIRGESMLVTTDSIEEFSHEISSSKNPSAAQSHITDLLNDCDGATSSISTLSVDKMSKSESMLSVQSNEQLLDEPEREMDCLNAEWLAEKKHVFIMSTAGKPIYSLHGNENKLASFFGIMQALVSVVQSTEDSINSIHVDGVKFVFLVRPPLILAAVSRSGTSVQQIQLQLTDVYNQILSILTLSHMQKIFEKRKNFDLRRLLEGSERLIDHLLSNDSNSKKVSNNPFTFLTHSVRILPLSTGVRDTITSAIQNNCSKIKNLVFAVLLANNKLIALVRMKKYFINPADLRLVFNLIECSESFKSSESWTPICLPKFDPNGFLHAHVSYLAEDCVSFIGLLWSLHFCCCSTKICAIFWDNDT